jgi:hypothetical protein
MPEDTRTEFQTAVFVCLKEIEDDRRGYQTLVPRFTPFSSRRGLLPVLGTACRAPSRSDQEFRTGRLET